MQGAQELEGNVLTKETRMTNYAEKVVYAGDKTTKKAIEMGIERADQLSPKADMGQSLAPNCVGFVKEGLLSEPVELRSIMRPELEVQSIDSPHGQDQELGLGSTSTPLLETVELVSTTPSPHRCSLESKARETRFDCKKPSGNRCKGKTFSPLTKASPITKPDEVIDSKYGRDSSPSLGARNTLLPLSIFGQVLLSRDSSGVGDSMEEEVGEAHIPLCIVEADDKDWDLNSKEIRPDLEKEYGSELCMTNSGKGNEAWEESCLVKFSEFLGFSVKGQKEEILSLMRRLSSSKRNQSGVKGQMVSTRSERELKKLECSINYKGLNNGRGPNRDRGELLLKLQ